ncbi:glucosaminidase domain-containing protein [Parasediminibacterium paludis]|uniref:Glucosaminidase domain-containing protein n=1 Tax=Parasediminibacterium paludis TaxID=908966 RepID=A0ABV8PWL1_9BACT
MKIILLLLVGLCIFSPIFAVSENDVYCYMNSIGIQHSEVVLKQAIYESGHFKSRIFKSKNNLFGFRRTKTYMKFKSWQSCIDFYKKWQDKYYHGEEDYYQFLQKKNFAGNKKFNYAKQLKNIKIRDSLNC